MRVKFVVEIEDRALFHFGAASKGARFSYAMR